MQVDIDHVLFWMDAIRNSKDQYRTLESFWKGQVKSKLWLIDSISSHISSNNNSIVIHGGWNGVLASLLFQSAIKIDKIVSLDIDPSCEEIARTMNKIEDISGKFQAITCNMIEYRYNFFPDVVINTSCEHISQADYDAWLTNIPKGSIIVLQSNNYKIEEHVRTVDTLEEFQKQSKINVWKSTELPLPLYTRFMLIGSK
jgi:L-2-hydroxyglutarate oxidase LhgO